MLYWCSSGSGYTCWKIITHICISHIEARVSEHQYMWLLVCVVKGKIWIYVLMHTSSQTTRNLTKHSTLFLTLQVRTCRAFLTLFSLSGSSHCSFYSLFVFLKDSCGNQILAQSAKNNTHKEHQKGKQTEGLILLRFVSKDKNKELFANPSQKGTTWTDNTSRN